MRIKGDTGAVCRQVDDAAEIRRLRWFQTRRYHEVGIIDDLPSELEDDPLVAKSVYFGVYSPRGEIWGTGRFIKAPNPELPIFRDFELDPRFEDMLHRYDDEVAEISRLTVSKDAPRLEALATLSREMFKFSTGPDGHTISIGAVERPMIRIIKRTLQMPCDVIGKVRHHYYNASIYPVLLDTVKYLNDMKFRDYENWKYFTGASTVDLRDERPPLVTVGTQADEI